MRTLLPDISREVLARMAADQPINTVQISVDGKGGFQYGIS